MWLIRKHWERLDQRLGCQQALKWVSCLGGAGWGFLPNNLSPLLWHSRFSWLLFMSSIKAYFKLITYYICNYIFLKLIKMYWSEKDGSQVNSPIMSAPPVSNVMAFTRFLLLPNSKLLRHPRWFMRRRLCRAGVGMPNVLIRGLEDGKHEIELEGSGLKIVQATRGLPLQDRTTSPHQREALQSLRRKRPLIFLWKTPFPLRKKWPLIMVSSRLPAKGRLWHTWSQGCQALDLGFGCWEKWHKNWKLF